MTQFRRRRFLAALGIAAIAGCSEGDTDQSATGSGSGGDGADGSGGGTSPTESGPAVAELRLGEVVSRDGLALVLRDVTTTEQIGDFQEADPGNEFYVLRLAIKNEHDSRFVRFSSLLQTRLVDDEDFTYDQSFSVTERPIGQGKLAPGEVSRGDIVFEVPQDATGLELEFDFEAVDFFGLDRVTVDLEQTADTMGDVSQTLQVPILEAGERASASDTTVVVHGMETTTSLGQFTNASEGSEYVIVDISVTNDSDEPKSVSIIGQMDCKDGEGFTYTVDIGAYSQLDRQFSQGSQIAAGSTRRGKIAYEVPQGSAPLYWTFDFSLFASGDKTFWGLR